MNVGARLVRRSPVIHFIEPVDSSSAIDTTEHESVRTPVDLDEAARIRRVDVVDHVLQAVAPLERVEASAGEHVVIVDVERGALRGVEYGDLRPRGVLELRRTL